MVKIQEELVNDGGGGSGLTTNTATTDTLKKAGEGIANAFSEVGAFIGDAYKSFTAQPSGDIGKESQVGLGYSSTSNKLNNSSVQGGVGTANPTVVERVTSPTASPGSNNYYYGFNPYQPNANLGMSTVSNPTSVKFFDPKKASKDALAASQTEEYQKNLEASKKLFTPQSVTFFDPEQASKDALAASQTEEYQKNLADAKKLFEEKVPPEESVPKFDPDSEGYDKKTGLNIDGLNRDQVKAKELKGLGTDDSLIKPFSWMQEGKDAAQVQYDADALKAEQNALFARQEFMTKSEQGQTQKDVQKYLDAQSAEKAGWTGGYRLDQDRQRAYLEATVQASMYNSQEMQRFGLESSLQAARLAYEQGKDALAMEYYKIELDRSMNEAQLTGVYFSPEQKDMLGQYRAANDIYNNLNSSQEYKTRAGQIVNSINNWFGNSGLSKEGIKTLAKLESDRNDLMVKQSVIKSAIETIPSGAYALKDNKGNYIMSNDGLTVQYFMPSLANSADKFDYFSGNYVIDGKTVDTGKQVFVQELNKLNNETLNTWYGNLSQADKEKSATELTAMLSGYMATASNPLHNFAKGIVNENNQQLNYEEVLGGTGKYKDGFYQTEFTINGKTFGVNYNLNSGEVVVRDSVANKDNTPSGVVLADENKNQVIINQSNNFTNFSASNPALKLYRETSGGMAGNTLVEIKDRNDLNLNQFNSTTAEVNKENYKKLFTETYNLFGGAYVYDYYGKLVDGKVMLKRVQTNK